MATSAASRTFAAGTENIDCGSDSSLDNLPNSGASMACWIYTTDLASQDGRIIAKSQSGHTNHYFQMMQNSGNDAIEFRDGFSNTRGRWRSPTNSIVVNTWYHITVTFDGSSTTNDPIIYIDGESVTVTEIQTPDGTRLDDSAQSMIIGNTNADDRDWIGDLSNAQVWNRILSASEVKDVMHNPGSVPEGLVLWVPIWGTSTEYDVSGTGNDGILSGTTTSNNGPSVFFLGGQ